MVFRLGQFVNGAAEKSVGWGAGRVLTNPVFAALIVALLAVVLVFAVLGADPEVGAALKKASWRTIGRFFIAMVVGAGLLLALHQFLSTRKISSSIRGGAAHSLVDQIHRVQQLPTQLQQNGAHHVAINPVSMFSSNGERRWGGSARPHNGVARPFVAGPADAFHPGAENASDPLVLEPVKMPIM
jgi:hypothetical protein